MKFKDGSACPAPDVEALARDYEQARDLGEVRLGRLGLYLPRLTHIDFLPLESLAHVYLRLEDIPVGMGCRRVPVGQYYLMAVLGTAGSARPPWRTAPRRLGSGAAPHPCAGAADGLGPGPGLTVYSSEPLAREVSGRLLSLLWWMAVLFV